MKKLAIIVGLASILMAGRYPIWAEFHYMSGCVNAESAKAFKREKLIDYCACTLKGIEEEYTLTQFLTNMETNKEAFLKKLTKTIVPKCLNELVE